MKSTELDKSSIIQLISELCNIDEDKIDIATEIDEHGKVIKIYVLVKDGNSAEIISDVINECSQTESNKTNDTRTECNGFLRNVRKVQLYIPREQPLSSSQQKSASHCLFFISLIISFIINVK